MARILEYFVGGGADKGDLLSKVVGATNNIKLHAQAYRDQQKTPVITDHYGHEEYTQLLIRIQADLKRGDTVNLTGHSWGGGAAIRIAQKLKQQGQSVNILITLDPVSLLPLTSPVGARIWVNVYQKQTLVDAIATVPVVGNAVAGIASAFSAPFADDASDTIATLGGQLGYQNKANINKETTVGHAESGLMYIEALNALTAKGERSY
ncbi:hypothetical protein WH50_04185 [Pokkaliibacter plantistimulans]|uniref:Alpha/beta hydrolase n=1 Tax=Pokkaliibacter plantistimulans TaxID=1635171 RepID=A0ABX5M6H0_9GAMM|nr:hypothetical protein [Pokkaliibacter plantistimulans]PXF32490.1 hypothetical protein WH50_04185 [Pokkaliibacter plantistimulans]